jgi:hypothetical protein
MSYRDKDSADFDLEAFADLFDTAMTSDNPAVQKAFKNLMLIAAIVNSENKDEAICKGPMRRLIEDQKNIVRRLNELENQKMYPGGGFTPMPSYPPGPTWITPNTGNPPPGWPPNTTITCSVSSTAYDDQFIPDPTDKVLGLYDKLEAK